MGTQPAVHIGRIATGEIEEKKTEDDAKAPNAQALESKGGRARMRKLSPERRAEIAKKAAAKRWAKKPG